MPTAKPPKAQALAKTNADNTYGVVFVLSCETDFVAKNDNFVQFAHSIADLALESRSTSVEDLMNQTMDGMTMQEKLTEQVGRIGEKLEISKFDTLTGELVVPYIHAGNKVAVLVALNAAGESLATAAKDVAMQVAAMSPIAVDEEFGAGRGDCQRIGNW